MFVFSSSVGCEVRYWPTVFGNFPILSINVAEVACKLRFRLGCSLFHVEGFLCGVKHALMFFCPFLFLYVHIENILQHAILPAISKVSWQTWGDCHGYCSFNLYCKSGIYYILSWPWMWMLQEHSKKEILINEMHMSIEIFRWRLNPNLKQDSKEC